MNNDNPLVFTVKFIRKFVQLKFLYQTFPNLSCLDMWLKIEHRWFV